MKSIGVIGASGFLGRALIKKLVDEKYNIKILTRNKFITNDRIKIYYGDISKEESNYRSFFDDIDVFINCAGESRKEKLMHKTNVQGILNIYKNINNRKIHWIQISSVASYGEIYGQNIDENSECAPRNTYQSTRKQSEDKLIEICSNSCVKYTILRPNKIIGKDSKDHALNSMINLINNKLFFFISSKKSFGSYIHIDNVVDSILACIKNKNSFNQIYNVCDNINLKDLVLYIQNKLNRNYKIISLPLFFVKLIAYLSYIIPKFPLTHQRIKGILNTTSFSSEKIKFNLSIKFDKTIYDAIDAIINK